MLAEGRATVARNKLKWILIVVLTSVGVFAFSGTGWSDPLSLPPIHIEVGNGGAVEEVAIGINILILLTILILAPAILVMVTSFTIIIIVL